MSACAGMLRIAALGAVVLATACGAEQGRAGGAARALGADAAAPVDADAAAVPCGAVTAVGCCAGAELFWCAARGLRHASCAARGRCGWREARGYYDCDTAGSADPAGSAPIVCRWGDGGPPVDLSASDPDGGCGAVTIEGCCAGETLLFCDRGRVRAVSCAVNPACGWRARGQYYECGTAGAEDPAGAHPRVCPAGAPDVDRPPEDGGPRAPGAGGDGGGMDSSADAAGEGGAPEPGGACACSARGLAAPAGAVVPLLIAALLLARRRRGGHPSRPASGCEPR